MALTAVPNEAGFHCRPPRPLGPLDPGHALGLGPLIGGVALGIGGLADLGVELTAGQCGLPLGDLLLALGD